MQMEIRFVIERTTLTLCRSPNLADVGRAVATFLPRQGRKVALLPEAEAPPSRVAGRRNSKLV